MFYYAFLTWRKPVQEGSHYFSLHKKTSVTAFYIMLIHAIIIETLGSHWWLHDKSVILSIVLLVINIYSVIYFIGDIQAIRHNPMYVTNDKIYLSLGLSKKMVIPFENIKTIKWGEEASAYTKDKSTLEFIAKDLEDVKPHCLIEFNEPLKASLLLGFTRSYSRVTIRLDEPERFQSLLNNR